MRLRHWILGLAIGFFTGLLTGAFYAYTDWCLNPSGIFHDDQGTDWAVVMETVTSWWIPVAGGVTILSWMVFYLMVRANKK